MDGGSSDVQGGTDFGLGVEYQQPREVIYNFGLLLINLCKELLYIGNQEIGLLQSREVSALRHVGFLH